MAPRDVMLKCSCKQQNDPFSRCWLGFILIPSATRLFIKYDLQVPGCSHRTNLKKLNHIPELVFTFCVKITAGMARPLHNVRRPKS